MVFKPSPYAGPKGYGFTEALKRARKPYHFRNAALGIGIFGFVTAVCIL
jgi:hypothetical protein